MRQPLVEQIWESWEWKIREKLTDVNDIVRRIFYEYKLCSGGRMNLEAYEKFMRENLARLLREIGDEAEETKLINWAEEGIVRNDCKK